MVRADYLESRSVAFNGKDEEIHYFIGHINNNFDDLHKIIQLDQENVEYFVGDIVEIIEKCKEGCTRIVKDLIDMVGDDQMIREIKSFQSKMKSGHQKGKKKLIGLGGSKTTGADGLKRVKDFTRSKSPPAGFGVLEEEDEQKRKIKVKILSRVEEKRKKKKKKKKKSSKPRRQAYYGGFFPYGGSSTQDSSSGSGDAGGDGGGGGE